MMSKFIIAVGDPLVRRSLDKSIDSVASFSFLAPICDMLKVRGDAGSDGSVG